MAKLYTSRQIKRGFLGLGTERPKANLGQALVLTGGGAPIVLKPGQQATAGEGVWGGYDTLYEVDMGKKDLQFAGNTPAEGGGFYFHFSVSMSYQVSDPIRVINEQQDDPQPMLKRVITETLSRVTAQHDIENVKAATGSVRQALDANALSARLPFTLSEIQVQLELDETAKAFIRKKREQSYEAQLAREAADLRAARGEANMDEQKYEMELERKRKEFDLEQKRREIEEELNIQKMRVDLYKPIIEGGMWTVLVQQLAQYPDDINRVSEVIRQMHSQQVATDLEVLKTLVAGDMIQDRHVKDVTARLVSNLERNMRSGTAPAGAEQHPRLSAGDDDSSSSTASD
jgi:hypothetical protein